MPRHIGQHPVRRGLRVPQQGQRPIPAWHDTLRFRAIVRGTQRDAQGHRVPFWRVGPRRCLGFGFEPPGAPVHGTKPDIGPSGQRAETAGRRGARQSGGRRRRHRAGQAHPVHGGVRHAPGVVARSGRV
nr:MAG TPA: hypothetical protein [Caudoviricetes sp.]